MDIKKIVNNFLYKAVLVITYTFRCKKKRNISILSFTNTLFCIDMIIMIPEDRREEETL